MEVVIGKYIFIFLAQTEVCPGTAVAGVADDQHLLPNFVVLLANDLLDAYRAIGEAPVTCADFAVSGVVYHWVVLVRIAIVHESLNVTNGRRFGHVEVLNLVVKLAPDCLLDVDKIFGGTAQEFAVSVSSRPPVGNGNVSWRIACTGD